MQIWEELEISGDLNLPKESHMTVTSPTSVAIIPSSMKSRSFGTKRTIKISLRESHSQTSSITKWLTQTTNNQNKAQGPLEEPNQIE